MEYEDRISIETPEGVPLDLLLAGYGSRFSAQLIDGAIKVAVIAALLVALGLAGDYGTALAVLAAFVVYVGYDVPFETLAGGRTPGKRLSGMRVVRDAGEPVAFTASAIRNILRIIDGVGTGYAAGTIAILVSPRNQRLGDMAAGTLVVRDAPAPLPAPLPQPAPGRPVGAGWDVTGVSPDELAAVRRFLERRHNLGAEPRARLAHQLAEGLRRKIPGADELPAEHFLEALAAAKAQRR